MASRNTAKRKRELIDRKGEVRDLSKIDPKEFLKARDVLPERLLDLARAARRYRGAQKAPTKLAINIRLSPEVVRYFRSGGRGWQTRIDTALRKVAGLG